MGAAETALGYDAHTQRVADEARRGSQYPSGWRLVEIQVHDQNPTFTYRLNRDKLKQVRRREGRYLLRTNLTGSDPAELWRYYIQLTQVEEAFRNLKGDLAIRPICHQKEARIVAHTSPPPCSADLWRAAHIIQ